VGEDGISTALGGLPIELRRVFAAYPTGVAAIVSGGINWMWRIASV
jgi:hypothetical protein